jgi:hypothetical protein
VRPGCPPPVHFGQIIWQLGRPTVLTPLFVLVVDDVVKVLGNKVTCLKVRRVLFGSFFMFSNFRQLDSHNKPCVAQANLHNRIKILTFLDRSAYVYWTCVFVDFFIGYTSLPWLCSLLSAECLSIFENAIQFFLCMCLYDVFSLVLAEPCTNQI